MNHHDVIFAEDEMTVLRCKKNWSRNDLLEQEGLFFFKDIAPLLQLSTAALKSRVQEAIDRREDPWETMGVRKVWTHWLIRMKTFAPIYRADLEPKFQRVPAHWDGNRLLREKGVFLLIDVCKKIPFTTHQLRYQARNCRDSSLEIGIWKDAQTGMYLVQMERFSPWVQKIWLEGIDTKSRKAKVRPAGAKPKTTARKPRPSRAHVPARPAMAAAAETD